MARICNHCIKNFRLNFSDSPSPPCTSSFAPNRIIIAAKNPLGCFCCTRRDSSFPDHTVNDSRTFLVSRAITYSCRLPWLRR